MVKLTTKNSYHLCNLARRPGLAAFFSDLPSKCYGLKECPVLARNTARVPAMSGDVLSVGDASKEKVSQCPQTERRRPCENEGGASARVFSTAHDKTDSKTVGVTRCYVKSCASE